MFLETIAVVDVVVALNSVTPYMRT